MDSLMGVIALLVFPVSWYDDNFSLQRHTLTLKTIYLQPKPLFSLQDVSKVFSCVIKNYFTIR